MNLDVALHVVQLGKRKPEGRVVVVAASAVVDFPMDHAKCSQLFARLAEKQRLFLSNRLRIGQFIAENAMSHQHVTIFKSFMVQTFSAFIRAWEGFFVIQYITPCQVVNNLLVKPKCGQLFHGHY